MKEKVTAVLLLLTLLPLVVSTSHEWDGTFDKPSKIQDGLNRGLVSFEEVAQSTSESVFQQVLYQASPDTQAGLLKAKFQIQEFSIASKGTIVSFDNDMLTTSKVRNFDLNEFRNFQGEISINNDGSISITKDEGDDIPLMVNNEKALLKSGEVKLASNTELVVEKGKIVIQGVGVEASQDPVRIFLETSPNTETGFVYFSKSSREIKINANGVKVSVTKEMPYDTINILGGNDIRLINGEMKVLYTKNKLIHQTPFGLPEKSLILVDEKNKHTFLIDKEKTKLLEVVQIIGYGGDKFQGFARHELKRFFLYFVALRAGTITLPDGTSAEGAKFEIRVGSNKKVVEEMSKQIRQAATTAASESSSPSFKSEMKKESEFFVGQLKEEYLAKNGKVYPIGYSDIYILENGLVISTPDPESYPECKHSFASCSKSYVISPEMARYAIREQKKKIDEPIKKIDAGFTR